ncbi:MAG TPA: hypothetical protein VLV83_12710, partial [Acidobacteriota bacterium]|nr:hypothetical protein [Acidobacteriota bacterium]
MADAADEPGALPLLQETMRLLWPKMQHRMLSYHAYETLSDGSARDGKASCSGLAVAIAMKADATLAALTQAEQAIARRIFLRLIQFGEGRADTRRQQPMSALRAAGDAPGEFERTLEHLTKHRLLTRSGADEGVGPSVDIAHEALITGWSRLQVWVEERREAEQVRRRLENKTAEWVRLGRGSGGLLDEAELPEAERWLASPDVADLGYDEALPAFVQASQQAIEAAAQADKAARQRELAQERALVEQQTRSAERMRRALLGLAAVLLVAVVAGLFAWTQGRKAQILAAQEAAARQEAEARRFEAENARLATIAQLLLVQAPQQQASLNDEGGALMARQAFLFSAAGSRPLKAQVDNVLRTAVGKPYFSPVLRRQSTPSVAISPDGTKLASTHTDPPQVLVWDLTQPGTQPVSLTGYPAYEMLPGASGPAGRLHALTFSPNGKTLVAANVDGAIGQWDLERPHAPFVELPRLKGGVWSAAYSPDGHWLAMGSKRDDAFAIWDLDRADAGPTLVNDPQPARPGSGPSMASEGGVPVAFSPDSTTLATGSLNGTVRLWRSEDLTKPIASFSGHKGSMLALEF